jgi:membrane protein
MLSVKDAQSRLRAHVVHLLESPTDELGRLGRLAVYQIRLWRFCWRQLVRDRLVTVAGDLSFKTLLALIPAMVLALLVINFFSRGADVGRQVEESLFGALNITELRLQVGGAETDLAQEIHKLVDAAQSRISAAAAVGVLVLFYITMDVLATIEAAMNRIWQISARRSLWRRFVMFWLVLTIGPPAVALAVYISHYIYMQAGILPGWLAVAGRGAVGLAATWFVLFVFYKLLPNAPVRSAAALAGALVAGTVWHVAAKEAFGYYVGHAVGYGRIYGSLGVVPLFFVWVYVTWLFVLFGCELAYVVQNFDDLARAESLERRREQGRFLAADFVALMAMSQAVRQFRRGQGPASLAGLAEATGAAPADLEEILGRLAAANLLARTPVASAAAEGETAWLPARDPASVTVADVLRAAGARRPLPADANHLALHRQVSAVLERVENEKAGAAGLTSLADLVAEPPPSASHD